MLSHGDFMDVASKLSNASQRNKKCGTLVSALMLHMLDIANVKSSSDLSSDLESNLNDNFHSLVQNYNTSFRSVTDVSAQQNSTSVTLPPNAMLHNLASSKRLIPHVEKLKNLVSRKVKKSPNCNACKIRYEI